MDVIGLLKQLLALHSVAVEPLYEGAPVTQPELEAMMMLRHAQRPGIARTLAAQLGLSRAAMSKTLARLENRGFVGREANPADRRAALVRLTPEGERVVDAMFPEQLGIEVALLGGLTEDERRRVLDALELLKRTLAGAPVL
ncbi:MarR family transcriptional regulator [Amycolatopsis sp. K13G38]|uniref:MarR family transcriptional regulator n=1 Tax=Amycolatopsis acididurans TaxID=2724524 RepID=A0ABX1J6C5_9PSEU|nr:MarR family transcriptional regulator [Amycolatopsis acididurans]NKQ55352.1 MarR family transcriptional regulator [Amycolatopsis acididurans]